jgi:hypothetical protein
VAGIYGKIDSREAFYRVLGEARESVLGILTQWPEDGTMQLIFEELDAMRRWCDGGREPSDNQRGSINVGLIAARDLSKAKGKTGELVQKLFALNNYFEDWPTDAEAASAKDENFTIAK